MFNPIYKLIDHELQIGGIKHINFSREKLRSLLKSIGSSSEVFRGNSPSLN